MPTEPITQEALDRLEKNLERRIELALISLESIRLLRSTEVDRRLGDLNNSHEKAIQEKKRTDESALKVQENSVTRLDLQVWKDEVNRRLDLAAGAARTWAVIGTLVGSVLGGIISQLILK